MARFKATAEDKAKAKARRDKLRAMVREIAALSAEERAALAARMVGVATVDGRVLSVKNQCLLALQCPGATIVGGFQQWRAHGRTVKRGEHGAMIWVPTFRKRSDSADPGDGSAAVGEDVGFIIGTVFDVGQTEPMEESAEESPALETVAA